MGRSSNRKWANRMRRWLRADVAEKLRLQRLYGRHPRFDVLRIGLQLSMAKIAPPKRRMARAAL